MLLHLCLRQRTLQIIFLAFFRLSFFVQEGRYFRLTTVAERRILVSFNVCSGGHVRLTKLTAAVEAGFVR